MSQMSLAQWLGNLLSATALALPYVASLVRPGGTCIRFMTSWSRGETKLGPVARLDCSEGQTESRACALFTEREVSFRVEASARTMTKESS